MRKSKLLNVRLQADDAGKVRALQERGIEISTIVRHAVRSEYARRVGSPARADVVQALRDIYAAHPAQPIGPRGFDVHDRRAFASAMRRHLRARNRR